MPDTIPTAIIVMGVTSIGKSTVGALIGGRLGWTYRDGDGFHPPENVEKMRSGTPLDDADRWPWLAAIAAWIAALRAKGEHGVVACSALKRAYRDRLRDGHDDVRFVFLHGDRETIAKRMAMRRGHYMPPSLLASQLATLEPPSPDENPVTVDIGTEPQAIAEAALRGLGLPRL